MSVTAAALGWAVLHFLWQGTLIGLLSILALELVPRRSAAVRYSLSCFALGVCLASFTASFLWLHGSLAEMPAIVMLPDAVDLSHPDYSAAAPILAQLSGLTHEQPSSAMGVVAWLWILGALVMAVRLARAGAWAQRLRLSGATPVDARWQAMLDGLRRDIGLGRRVRIMCSELVDGPLVIGWLQPLILVPATTFTALTPEQVRSVLAHELAHIRRYDHLVNALQALVEVTLFFHPVVWWLSRVARDEREHCCDRVAIDATGRPLDLARALTRLESLRLIRPTVALAANDPRGPLMQRIQRILDIPAPRSRRPLGWRAMTIVCSAALVAGLGLSQASATPSPVPSARASMEGRDAASDYAIVEGRVLEAVEAGNLSASDAKRTLVALRKTMLGSHVARDVFVEWQESPSVDPAAVTGPRQGQPRLRWRKPPVKVGLERAVLDLQQQYESVLNDASKNVQVERLDRYLKKEKVEEYRNLQQSYLNALKLYENAQLENEVADDPFRVDDRQRYKQDVGPEMELEGELDATVPKLDFTLKIKRQQESLERKAAAYKQLLQQVKDAAKADSDALKRAEDVEKDLTSGADRFVFDGTASGGK